MSLLGRLSKGRSSRVGPVILSLYERVGPDQRAALRKTLSGAPSGCEIVAAYKDAPDRTDSAILGLITKKSLPGPGVIGAMWFGGCCTIYVKGDFPAAEFANLVQEFTTLGTFFKLDVEVVSGRFGQDELSELL